MSILRSKQLILRAGNCGQFQSLASLATQTAPITEKCPFEGEQKKPHLDEFQTARPFSEIPGPSGFELVKNMLLPSGKYYKLGINKLHEKLYEEYGNVLKIPGVFGREPIVVLYDSRQVEKIFRNEGPWPNRYSFGFFDEFRNKVRPDIFKGIGGLVQDQGQQWQDTRTKVNPVMMQPKTVQRYIPTVDRIATDFVNRIREIRDEKNEVTADFGNEMNKWALESIAYIALDQRLGLLTDLDPNSDGQKLIQSVHDFFQLSYDLEVQPNIWKWYKTPTYHKVMDCLNLMTDIIVSYIDKSIADLENKPKDKDHEESVLEKLLKIDKRVAVVMALDMLMAGVDTTSNTVLSLLNLLAQNPDKQQILRAEILEKLPTKDSTLTADAMKNMPYLRACIKESQRLQPVVLGNMRKLPKDIVLSGYLIPKGHHISTSSGVMHYLEENFERPREFLPERFLKGDSCPAELKAKNPFAYLPFGFGARMCIGKRLAELEMEILTSKLLRSFEVEWHYPEIKYATNILNAPTGDLKFRFVDLKE